MKLSLGHVVLLAVLSMAAFLFFAPTAEAQPAADQFDSKLSISVSPAGPAIGALKPQRLSRTATGRAADESFPTFAEEPHGAPGLAENYTGSFYDENGRLWDRYEGPGWTIDASTNYYKEK